jgi:hypothetical protein
VKLAGERLGSMNARRVDEVRRGDAKLGSVLIYKCCVQMHLISRFTYLMSRVTTTITSSPSPGHWPRE